MPFDISYSVDYHNFSSRHKCFLTTLSNTKEPQSFREAMQSLGWRKAMQEEIDALERNGTWTLEDLPPGKRAISGG